MKKKSMKGKRPIFLPFKVISVVFYLLPLFSTSWDFPSFFTPFLFFFTAVSRVHSLLAVPGFCLLPISLLAFFYFSFFHSFPISFLPPFLLLFYLWKGSFIYSFVCPFTTKKRWELHQLDLLYSLINFPHLCSFLYINFPHLFLSCLIFFTCFYFLPLLFPSLLFSLHSSFPFSSSFLLFFWDPIIFFSFLFFPSVLSSFSLLFQAIILKNVVSDHRSNPILEPNADFLSSSKSFFNFFDAIKTSFRKTNAAQSHYTVYLEKGTMRVSTVLCYR